MAKRDFRYHRPLYSRPHAPKSVQKVKWRILPIIWLAIKRTSTAIGFLVLINIILAIFVYPALFSSQTAAPALPDEMVLYMKFEGGFLETPATASLSDPFAGSALTVRDITSSLDRAANDTRVQGIIARMNDGNFNITQVAEIRIALKKFRQSGKFAHIYSSSYGDGAGGMSRYYLASAFDEIWMQPLGIVSITGLGAEVPFFRETMDKIGVAPQFFKRKDYKTAYESMTDKQMSAPNREMMTRMVNDIKTEILSTIPEERGMSVAQFEALVNQGLFTAPEAEKAGLITKGDYGDILLDNIAEKLTGKRDFEELNMVSFESYAADFKKKGHSGIAHKNKPKVALIYTTGAIMPSSDGGGIGAISGGVAAADKIAPAILMASKDDDVKAIILRIDSPGGSPAASESILRAVEKAKERGKPVIVSMGATAASGGYWVAAYADRIFALPTTLTGSIGVVGGKFVFNDLFKKLGVNWEEITWGRNANMWSVNTRFDAGEAERMNAMLDNIYDNFVARVAKGRNMTPEAVDKIAGGRVWTGRSALKVGLVDELGGLDAAMDYTATTLGKQNGSELAILVYPKPKTTMEQIFEFLGTQTKMAGVMQNNLAMQSHILDAVSPVTDAYIMQKDAKNYMTYAPLELQ